MAITFGQDNIVIGQRWTELKAMVASKSLILQYDEGSDVYSIFAIDDKIVYSTNIWKLNFPNPPDYSQATNDADKTDFETNFKAGGNKRIQRTDNFGNPIATPFEIGAMLGLIPGATTGRAQGYTATSAASGKAIRATTYTPQGTDAQRSLNSTSANDTSAGTGARTVTLTYLNTSFVLKTETVTMNGTTAVNTVATDIAFIESIVVASVGSVGGNVGTIQVWTATAAAGSVWGSIAASDNQTFWAHHYVPTGVTCYLLTVTAGATVVAGQTNLNRTGNPLNANSPQLQIGVTLIHVAAGTWDHDFEIPLAVAGPDFIFLVERPVAATASTAVAGFEYMQF